MRYRHYLLSLGVVLGMMMSASAATADPPDIYDWSHPKAPVMIHTEGSLVFLGQDREPRRAYEWDAVGGDNNQSLFVPDLDNDGAYDFVGAGEPTFALHDTSNPAWSIEGGCEQVHVADFAADDKLDIMCRGRTDIEVYTHDQQSIWSVDLNVPLEWCRAGDYNGDTKADLECKFRGRDTYTRIDVNEGDFIAQKSDESKLDPGAIDLDEASPVSSKVWKGEREFDFNGDGTAEESIQADGDALVLKSRSKDKAIARVELDDEVKAGLVKNLDGEGQPEIVAVTDDTITVLDTEGETLGTDPVDADDYERRPVAALDSVYARGFEDEEKAQKTVKEAQDRLAECYSDRIDSGLFVGIGQVIYKLQIGSDGEVTNLEQMHSALRDEEIEGCAENILEGLDYPGPKSKEDGENKDGKANLNVTLKFTFADEPR